MALIKIVNWNKPDEFLWLDSHDLGKSPKYVRWEDREEFLAAQESKAEKTEKGTPPIPGLEMAVESIARKTAKAGRKTSRKQKGTKSSESDQANVKPAHEHDGERLEDPAIPPVGGEAVD